MQGAERAQCGPTRSPIARIVPPSALKPCASRGQGRARSSQQPQRPACWRPGLSPGVRSPGRQKAPSDCDVILRLTELGADNA